jgi:hypothetical protein
MVVGGEGTSKRGEHVRRIKVGRMPPPQLVAFSSRKPQVPAFSSLTMGHPIGHPKEVGKAVLLS